MINIIEDYSHSSPKLLYSNVVQILNPVCKPDKGIKCTPILRPLILVMLCTLFQEYHEVSVKYLGYLTSLHLNS